MMGKQGTERPIYRPSQALAAPAHRHGLSVPVPSIGFACRCAAPAVTRTFPVLRQH